MLHWGRREQGKSLARSWWCPFWTAGLSCSVLLPWSVEDPCAGEKPHVKLQKEAVEPSPRAMTLKLKLFVLSVPQK